METTNGRRWRNLGLFLLLAVVGAALAGLAVSGYQIAAGFVHPQRQIRAADDSPERFGAPYEEVELVTGDGVTLQAWYTPPKNGSVILVAHGYPGRRQADVHAFFAVRGYGVLSWDARALGESGGEISTLGFHEVRDVKAALDFALAQPGVERAGAYGQSMGAATLVRAAAQQAGIEALVIDSSFASLDEMIEKTIPNPVLRPFVTLFAWLQTGVRPAAVRPVDNIGRISPRPVLIIQGEADQVVTPDSAERLYAAAGEPRELWIEPGAGHVGVFRSRPDEFERRVIGFFDAHLAGEEE